MPEKEITKRASAQSWDVQLQVRQLPNVLKPHDSVAVVSALRLLTKLKPHSTMAYSREIKEIKEICFKYVSFKRYDANNNFIKERIVLDESDLNVLRFKYLLDNSARNIVNVGKILENTINTPLIVSIPVTVITLVTLGLLYWIVQRRRRDATFKDLERFLNGLPLELASTCRIIPAVKNAFKNKYDKSFEIDRGDIDLNKTSTSLGSGQFGNVYKCILTRHNVEVVVAVKVPKKSIPVLAALVMTEVINMSNISPNINVLGLVGAWTKQAGSGQILFAMEYCEHGSLKAYLSDNRNRFEGLRKNDHGQFIGETGAVETLLDYSFQASSGMEFLSSQDVAHGDLALRNLLLTSNDIVKIADFGMSQQHKKKVLISTKDYLPIYWMAPELLRALGELANFDEKSDIWSFGVVLWEIFSCGTHPYSDRNPKESLVEFRNWLVIEDRHRLLPPSIACGDNIYNLMRTCWISDPDCRPTFTHCKGVISEYIKATYPERHMSIFCKISSKIQRFDLGHGQANMDEQQVTVKDETSSDTAADENEFDRNMKRVQVNGNNEQSIELCDNNEHSEHGDASSVQDLRCGHTNMDEQHTATEDETLSETAADEKEFDRLISSVELCDNN